MELIEKMARGIWNCNFHPDDVADGEAERRISDWPEDWAKAMRQAQAALTALIEHAGGDGVAEGDREVWREAVFDYGGLSIPGEGEDSATQVVARHRALAFVAGRAAREREIADAIERGEV